MKDGLGPSAVERIAASLERADPGFPKKHFTNDALTGLDALELKERVRHLIRVLHTYLPNRFIAAAETLVRTKNHWIPGDPDDNLAGFAAWPLIDYAGEYGLDHPEQALRLLKELTPLFSAEFSIRPFLVQHPDLVLRKLETWCTDPDEHVRRLVSEGTRPRLPWGSQLPQFIEDPSPVLRLLDRLRNDASLYVRRSVANNLNDISKDHPGRVISICRRWQKTPSEETGWIIRHATRTLVKSGHPEVFGLLGFTEDPEITLCSLDISAPHIRMGETIEFTATLQSTAKTLQKIVVDYAVHHVKADGQSRPKVFKFRQLELAADDTVAITKSHSFKPVSTRTYYSGSHTIEILINGKSLAAKKFNLNANQPQ